MMDQNSNRVVQIKSRNGEALLNAIRAGNKVAILSFLTPQNRDSLDSQSLGSALWLSMALCFRTKEEKENYPPGSFQLYTHIIIKLLTLQRPFRFVEEESQKTTLLFHAIEIGDFFIVQKILELGLLVDDDALNWRNDNGESVLFRAIAIHHEEHDRSFFSSLVALLLKQPKVNVNLQNKQGLTPLMYAVACGCLYCVTALLAHPNLNLNLVNHKQQSALEMTVALDGMESQKTIRRAIVRQHYLQVGDVVRKILQNFYNHAIRTQDQQVLNVAITSTNAKGGVIYKIALLQGIVPTWWEKWWNKIHLDYNHYLRHYIGILEEQRQKRNLL